jgi:hypothetical protein
MIGNPRDPRRGDRATASACRRPGLSNVAMVAAVRRRHRAGRRLFGSVQAAIAAAGCDPTRVQRRQRRTDLQIADELRRLAGAHPSMALTELHASHVGLAAKARHGTLHAALAAVGIRNWPRRRRHQLPSRTELLEVLQRRHARGDPMGQNHIVASKPRLVKAAYKHFGTWRAAMTAAGLGSNVTPGRWAAGSSPGGPRSTG